MNPLSKTQLDALAREIGAVVERRASVGADYAAEVAVYAAGYGASLLTSPDPDGLDRFRAQARAMTETLNEIGDQAMDEILDEVVGGFRFLLAVGRAAL